ncbi:MAG TPA: polysaccharide biosynthesis tyrosine autokinase [Phycisphaerae bacterium]|nr:polysaccharide biosynthesis tyrosine autokinase [Phycisphaerae bacterium]
MSQQPTVAAPGSAMALTPADVWRVVRKRFWLIVACFVVFGLGGVGAVVAWRFWAPYYTAEGAIEVEPGQAQAIDLTRGYQEAIDVRLFPQYVESQVRAILNPRVLTAALEALKGQQTMYPGSTAYAAYELGEDLDVIHLVNTQHILVSLTGTDPAQVRDIVHEVLTEYIAQLKADRQQADADRQQELRAERDDLRRQLDELGRKLASYRDESAVIVADERGGEQLATLNALARQLTVAQVELAAARADWTQFQELRRQAEETKDLSAVLMSFPAVMDTMRRDPTIVSLTQMSARYSQELEGLEQRFGPQHESVRRLKVSAQAIVNDLEAKQSEVLSQLIQQQAAVLKNVYDSARNAEAELQTRVAEARAAALSAAKLTAEYRAREDEYRRVQTMLNTVLDGLERMRISAAIARPNIRIVGRPDIPLEPTQPRVVLYSVAAILFSLLVGVGLSLLIELVDTRLRTPAQVVRHIGVPMLARVPDLTEDNRLSLDTNLALVSHTAPHSLLAESFRQLRTHLLFSSDKPIRSLLITSPGPGDGKTTVAVNLAISMARTGERVLLVEANFRRPALSRIFDVPDAIGLSNVLVGLNSISEAVQATAIENLDVLVGGPPPPSPAGLVGCETMRQLVAEEVESYDRVIVDGAPMLVVADNHLVTPMLDGVILVFHAGENTRGVAQRAVQQIVMLHGRLFGAVLNRVRATKGGYFRESFQAYYDYAGARPDGRAVAAVTPAGQPDRDVNGTGGTDTT